MAQRPRPPSPQITWREVKSARRRPPLLRSRPRSPERPRRTTGAVRRRPRPIRTLYVTQCFSEHFHVAPIVPGRLPSDSRSSGRRPSSQCFSEHFRGCDTTTGWPASNLPACLRSSPVGPGEVLRSTATPATIFRTVQCATRLPSANFPVVSRQTRGPPVDSRSRHALPIILTYDATRLPRTNESPAVGR